MNSGFKRTLCGGKWESLSGNSYPGNYLTSTGRLGCCPPGTFMNSSTSTVCDACTAGQYSDVDNDDTSCNLCVDQAKCVASTLNTCSTTSGIATKTPCTSVTAPGYYLDGDKVATCATSDNGANAATVTCTNGTNQVATTCNAGYWLDGTTCTSCATSGNGANAATVTCTSGINQVATTCNAGYGLVGSACVACDAFTYAVQGNSAECQTCASGSYTDTGTGTTGTTCTPCATSGNGANAATVTCTSGINQVATTCNAGYGLLAVRVLRVMRLHTPFKATARSVNPVRQVRTPTLELAPPAPRVKPVIPVAPVPTWPQSRARRAPTKSRPLATPVTGWLKVRVLRVMRLHTPFKATARSVNPVRQVRTPTLELAPPAPRVHRVQPVAMVPTRPRSRARRAPTKSRPLATPVTGWLKVRVLRVMRLHTPFKATARSVNPVRQVRTPTLELAPPAPRVHRVQPVAMVPMRPRSRVLRASIKSQPLATPVTGWLKVRVLRVMRLHTPFKATARSVNPVRQVRTPTLELAPPAPRVHRVQPVAMVPMRPRSRVLRASIKSQPPVTLATGLLAVRVLQNVRLLIN